MSPRARAPRVLAITGVAAAHAAVLLGFLTLTRTASITSERHPVMTLLLMPLEPESAGHAPARPRAPAAHAPPSAEAPAVPEPLAPPPPPAAAAPAGSIDWAGAAASAAVDQAETEERRQRQARALAPPPSPAFAAPPARKPQFGWDYTGTHRFETLRGGISVIHLGDDCGVALYLLIPMGFGCAVGKTPARGDLFEHMHDGDGSADPQTH
jgi:hypothetical protein